MSIEPWPVVERESAPTRDSFLAGLRAMDQDRWVDLDRRFRGMIISRARQAGLNDADADDVAQNVFTAMAQNPPGPSPRPGSFRAWMRELTRWKIGDRVRELKRARLRQAEAVNLPGREETEPAPPADDSFGRIWDQEMDRHLEEVALQRVARRVRPRSFQAFQMTEKLGWDPARVAAELGMARATVYVQRFRILRRVKQEMAALLAEMDECLENHARGSKPPG